MARWTRIDRGLGHGLTQLRPVQQAGRCLISRLPSPPGWRSAKRRQGPSSTSARAPGGMPWGSAPSSSTRSASTTPRVRSRERRARTVKGAGSDLRHAEPSPPRRGGRGRRRVRRRRITQVGFERTGSASFTDCVPCGMRICRICTTSNTDPTASLPLAPEGTHRCSSVTVRTFAGHFPSLPSPPR
jgi:hypothetical protein